MKFLLCGTKTETIFSIIDNIFFLNLITNILSFFRNFCFSSKRAHYVDQLNMLKDRAPLAKLRLSAHNLEIERGRYMQVNRE